MSNEIFQKIADPKLRAQAERVASFHGYLSTGAFVGIQMLNIARKVLNVSQEERLFVICETYNCLPDPFQALAGCTIGNKGLKIRDWGKMAATVSPHGPPGGLVRAVRIMLDPAKTAKYPRLHSWFMKSYKVSHPEAVSILIEAEESVYTWKLLDLMVPKKPEKMIRLCGSCGESFISHDDKLLCQSCLDASLAEDRNCPQS
ncbi:FmdE, Molybdenum formylmethanofuran dehydrogenase operon [uncultured archaeon]|nr:FmdE, Molybdenum formylmethanofuran dehydrogenase operon [uncultured archaeon]